MQICTWLAIVACWDNCLLPIVHNVKHWWFVSGTQRTSYIKQNEAVCCNCFVESHWSQTEKIECCVWSFIIWILPAFKVRQFLIQLDENFLRTLRNWQVTVLVCRVEPNRKLTNKITKSKASLLKFDKQSSYFVHKGDIAVYGEKDL